MIITERLVLKSYTDKDQKDMIELLTNEKIKETFMIPDFYKEDEAISLFKKLKEYSYSEEHYYVGIYKDEQLIGFINDVYRDTDKIELGYVIHPNFHNKGYITEALGAVIKDLFEKGFNEVMAGAFEANKASFRVMEKCGMKQIDKEEDIFYHGKAHHCIYYSIKRTIEKPV